MCFAQTVSFVPHYGFASCCKTHFRIFWFQISDAAERRKIRKRDTGIAYRRACISMSGSPDDARRSGRILAPMTDKNDRDLGWDTRPSR